MYLDSSVLFYDTKTFALASMVRQLLVLGGVEQNPGPPRPQSGKQQQAQPQRQGSNAVKACYVCGSVDHLAPQCSLRARGPQQPLRVEVVHRYEGPPPPRDDQPAQQPQTKRAPQRVLEDAPHIEIVNAWYGTEQINSDNNGRVAQVLRQNLARNGGNCISFPTGDLFGSFGFDPVPNVLKVCAVHVRVNGRDQHLRIQEGRPFEWVASSGSRRSMIEELPQQQVEIVHAWYGTEQINSDNNGRVAQVLRQNLARNGGNCISFPTGDLFGSFGFDPVPNVLKVCAVHVRVNGRDQHLRIQEGRPFQWVA